MLGKIGSEIKGERDSIDLNETSKKRFCTSKSDYNNNLISKIIDETSDFDLSKINKEIEKSAEDKKQTIFLKKCLSSLDGRELNKFAWDFCKEKYEQMDKKTKRNHFSKRKYLENLVLSQLLDDIPCLQKIKNQIESIICYSENNEVVDFFSLPVQLSLENGKNGENGEKNEKNELTPIPIPGDILGHIFSYMQKPKSFLDSIGTVCDVFYLQSLRSYDQELKISGHNIYSIPLLVIQYSKKIRVNIDKHLYVSEISYLCENMKNVLDLKLEGDINKFLTNMNVSLFTCKTLYFVCDEIQENLFISRQLFPKVYYAEFICGIGKFEELKQIKGDIFDSKLISLGLSPKQNTIQSKYCSIPSFLSSLSLKGLKLGFIPGNIDQISPLSPLSISIRAFSVVCVSNKSIGFIKNLPNLFKNLINLKLWVRPNYSFFTKMESFFSPIKDLLFLKHLILDFDLFKENNNVTEIHWNRIIESFSKSKSFLEKIEKFELSIINTFKNNTILFDHMLLLPKSKDFQSFGKIFKYRTSFYRLASDNKINSKMKSIYSGIQLFAKYEMIRNNSIPKKIVNVK
jgi:hypothetical protein